MYLTLHPDIYFIRQAAVVGDGSEIVSVNKEEMECPRRLSVANVVFMCIKCDI